VRRLTAGADELARGQAGAGADLEGADPRADHTFDRQDGEESVRVRRTYGVVLVGHLFEVHPGHRVTVGVLRFEQRFDTIYV